MSAAENKKLMEEIFAHLAGGDGALFVETLADDVVMRVTGQYTWSRTFEGKSSLLQELYGHLRTILEKGGRTIPKVIIAGDDYVVVEATGDMVTKAGVRYQNEYCLVFRLANRKIVEMREYNDSLLCEKILGPFPQRAP